MKGLAAVLAKLALLGTSLVLVAAFFELALQLAVGSGLAQSYVSMYGGTVPDDRLMWRLKPSIYADIDEAGYRNTAIPERVDLVGIGDSQTYGYNAFPEESWPHALAARAGKTAYSISIGGWGPVQYAAVVDRALELEPEKILFGFYMGNDFHDACTAGGAPYWRDQLSAAGIDMTVCAEMADASPPIEHTGVRELARKSEVMMRVKQIPLVRAFISVRRDVALARGDPDAWHLVEREGLETVVQLRDRTKALDPSSRRWRRASRSRSTCSARW